MARIPEAELERLKADVAVERLAEARRIVLTRRGADLGGPAPLPRGLIHLRLYDVDTRNGTLMVRQGKGQKDRMVPLGARAGRWIDRYVEEVRPSLVVEPDPGWLFLHEYGEPFRKNRLTDRVKKYIPPLPWPSAGPLFWVGAARRP